MSNTIDSTCTSKTAATACRWVGLVILAATIIMAIAHTTSLMPYLPVIMTALGATIGDMLVRSRVRAAEGKH